MWFILLHVLWALPVCQTNNMNKKRWQASQPLCVYPDNKVHGANMGPTWVGPCWTHESCYKGSLPVGLSDQCPLVVTGINFNPSMSKCNSKFIFVLCLTKLPWVMFLWHRYNECSYKILLTDCQVQQHFGFSHSSFGYQRDKKHGWIYLL